MKFIILYLNKESLRYAIKNNKYEIIYYLLTKRKYLKKDIFKDESKLRRVMIPPTIISIGDSSFESCSSLVQVSIPSSVTSIGLYAFCGCTSLKQVLLHSQIKSIDKLAFSFCFSLSKVTVCSFQTKIGEKAFCDCPLLNNIDFPFLDKNISYNGALLNIKGVLIQFIGIKIRHELYTHLNENKFFGFINKQ